MRTVGRLRVLVAVSEWPAYRRGLVARLCQSQEVDLVVVTSDKPVDKSTMPSGVRFLYLGAMVKVVKTKHPLGFEDAPTRTFPPFLETLRMLARESPDVIIASEFGMRTFVLLLFSCVASIPVVLWAKLTEHTELHRGLCRTLWRKVPVMLSDAFIVNGQSGWRYMARLGVPREKVVIAPYAIEDTELQGIPIHRPPAIRYRLLTVGQLIERKGLRECFKAICYVATTCPGLRIHWHIVGDGPLSREIADWRHSGVTIECEGAVSYATLDEKYRMAGIFVFPTLADEWGVVINEAMAAGLPVVGSRYSGAVSELVDDCHNGWLIDPCNIESFARILRLALCTSAAKLEEMGQKARRRISSVTPEMTSFQMTNAVYHANRLKMGIVI